jgi:CheY-like chemotaxis protein
VLDSALRLVDNDVRHRAHLVRDFRAIPDVLGNDARLSQVFLNLMVNAVQALESCPRERSEITVRTSTDDKGFAIIEISDTGVGIAPEHLSKIFDPFFTTKPVGLGTGIGLSICHGIVKSMNGAIEVESTLGRGSLFRVRLPSAPANARPALASAATGPRLRAGARLRILIVDDDQRVAQAMRQTLSTHDVTLADGAESGLRALEIADFDAIFCDLMMPGTTGVEFFARLSERRQSRVIFITGGAPTETARGLLERTQAICLYKPVTGEELEEALQRLTASVGPRGLPLDAAYSARNRSSTPPPPDVA